MAKEGERQSEHRLAAEIADVEAVSVDLSAGDYACNYFELCAAYNRIASAKEAAGEHSTGRVYRSIGLLCSFLQNFDNRADPFFPARVEKGGRRTLLPEDFSDRDLEVVEAIAARSKFAAVRARALDVLFTRKRRHDLWPQAVQAYLDLGAACLTNHPVEGATAFRRAVQIARALGRDKELVKQTGAFVADQARRTLPTLEPYHAVRLFAALSTMGAGDAVEWATMSENRAVELSAQGKEVWARELLTFAASWWTDANQVEKAAACKLQAAREFRKEADRGLLLENPVYGGIADVLIRAAEALRQAGAPQEEQDAVRGMLRTAQQKANAEIYVPSENAAQLVESQRKVLDDEARQITGRAVNAVSGKPFAEALRYLALSWPLSEAKKVREAAIKTAREFPITEMINTVYPDAQGRHQYRTEGLFAPEDLEKAMSDRILEHARDFHWDTRAALFIEPCREQILWEHLPAFTDWTFLIASNPLVPPGQAFGFTKGLQAGMWGDWVTAAHLLTPRFEGILRNLLERNRVDTTSLSSDLLQPGKMLGAMLGLTTEHQLLPEDFAFELRGHLNEKAGYNFRNKIAHGLAPDSECYGPAAVNIWWLALRFFMSLSEHPVGEDPSAAAAEGQV